MSVKIGDVKITWVDDLGGKVKGQWHVRTSFWECYPTEKELEDLVAAAKAAMDARHRENQN